MKSTAFQIHEHCVLNSNRSPVPRVVHAHARGDEPHQHPSCGPAFYGHLRQKPKFRATPTGEQLPWQDLEEWQKSFEIHISNPPAEYSGEGPGLLSAERLIHGFKMCVSRIVDHRTRGAR